MVSNETLSGTNLSTNRIFLNNLGSNNSDMNHELVHVVTLDGVELLNATDIAGPCYYSTLVNSICTPDSNLMPLSAGRNRLNLTRINPSESVPFLEQHPMITSLEGSLRVLPTERNREFVRDLIVSDYDLDYETILDCVSNTYYKDPIQQDMFRTRLQRFLDIGDTPLRGIDFKAISKWSNQEFSYDLLELPSYATMADFLHDQKIEPVEQTSFSETRFLSSPSRADSVSMWLDVRHTTVADLNLSEQERATIYNFVDCQKPMPCSVAQKLEGLLDIPEDSLFRAFDTVKTVHFVSSVTGMDSLRTFSDDNLGLAEVVSEVSFDESSSFRSFLPNKNELFVEVDTNAISDFKSYMDSKVLTDAERKLFDEYLKTGASAELEKRISESIGIPCESNFSEASGQSILDVAVGFRDSIDYLDKNDAREFVLAGLRGVPITDKDMQTFLEERDHLYSMGVEIRLPDGYSVEDADKFDGHLCNLPHPVVCFQDVLFEQTDDGEIRSWPLANQSDEEVRTIEQLLAYSFYGSNKTSDFVTRERSLPSNITREPSSSRMPHLRRATFSLKPCGPFLSDYKVSFVHGSVVGDVDLTSVDLSRVTIMPSDAQDLASKIFEARELGFKRHNEMAKEHPDKVQFAKDISDYRVTVDVSAELLDDFKDLLKGIKVQASSRMNDGVATDFDF